MILKSLFSTAIITLLATTLGAQINFDRYVPVQCEGEIPKDLVADAKLLYEQKALKIDDSDKAKHRKNDEKEFYLQNNFSIQDFLLSGQILYNDTFTRYIERIADTLLVKNPELRTKLRFYTVKSPEVNAFATQEGIVFVNIGLFSSAKSEAQIAYILAHEISHFTEGHVLQGYLETRKIVRGEGYYRYQDYYSRLRSFFRYSRDSEYEADAKGWELYKTSPYAKNMVKGVFDMLLYANVHYDSVPFFPSYFEDTNYRFPSDYAISTTDSLKVDENRQDNFSTHPNVKDRKKRTKIIIGQDSVGGLDYVVSSNTFENLQRIARYEMLRYYVANTDFADAYYHALLLEKTYGGGTYIDYIKGMSLYGLAMHFNNTSKKRVLLPYKSVQGTPQQFYYFLNQLTGKEMSILALRENIKLKEKYTNEVFFTKVEDDLIKQIIVNNRSRAEEFYRTARKEQLDEKEYYKYAFVKEMDDAVFFQKFQSFQTHRILKNKFYTKIKSSSKEMTELGKKREMEVIELSFFQPSFQKVQESLLAEPKVDYLSILEENSFIKTELQKAAAKNNISIKFVEETPMSYNTALYNNYSNYIDWFIERTNNNIEMVYYALDGPSDTSSSELIGVIEVQSVVKNVLIKKHHFWEYNFLVYSKENGALIYYQTLASRKKYKRKSLKKSLEKGFKTLSTVYPEDE